MWMTAQHLYRLLGAAAAFLARTAVNVMGGAGRAAVWGPTSSLLNHCPLYFKNRRTSRFLHVLSNAFP